MTRPTSLYIDTDALINNLQIVKQFAPGRKIVAMVKANAYGCGIDKIVPTLMRDVFAFGVSCLEEALLVRKINSEAGCVLFQGIFSSAELEVTCKYNLQLVIHQQRQLDWILQNPSKRKLKIWLKVNTGMNRLGFFAHEIDLIMQKLNACPWIEKPIIILTHLACADETDNSYNLEQINSFAQLTAEYNDVLLSMANSAAILGLPDSHLDIVRPGLMLYGISPYRKQSAALLGLKPVMRFVSCVSEIHTYPPGSPIGYNGIWKTTHTVKIGVVPVGYADGYPRVVDTNAKVWVAGNIAPIVGRISMDMLTIDLTTCKNVKIGEEVELWGQNISVNDVAESAGTIGHEIIARIGSRVLRK